MLPPMPTVTVTGSTWLGDVQLTASCLGGDGGGGSGGGDDGCEDALDWLRTTERVKWVNRTAITAGADSKCQSRLTGAAARRKWRNSTGRELFE
jgi:hypothetical protein